MDESDEQFEERVLNKRAYQLFTTVKDKLKHNHSIAFTDMCHRNVRKQVSTINTALSIFMLSPD